MTLKSNWSIVSDDENSRQSFLSDCDSEFDLSPPPRYPAEKCSTSALKKLSINRNEPPMTRSRTKAGEKTIINTQSVSKEQHQSAIRRSVDAFTDMATTFTNSILFPKQESSDNRFPNSPTDGVNKLADWFESCSLDESKCKILNKIKINFFFCPFSVSKNCLWPSCETNSHYMRPIVSSSPNVTFGSNLFSTSPISPLFVQSSSTTTTTLFGQQQQAQLWSRFRFAASNIRNNVWVEQLNSTSSKIFNSPNNNNHFSDQSPILSSSNTLLSSSPSQIVPSLLTKTPSSSIQESSSSLLRQRQITNSEISTKKEDIIIQQSSSKIFFTLIIFAIGLVLGYLLTNTFPPNLIRQWIFIIWEICIEISIKYFHLLYDYLQIVMKYLSSFTLG
jgi:hypothetical protein